MARTYLSDRIEDTWVQPEHETFVTLAERIENMLDAQALMDVEPEHDEKPVWCDGCSGWCSYDY